MAGAHHNSIVSRYCVHGPHRSKGQRGRPSKIEWSFKKGGKASKAFFSEERRQKTSMSCASGNIPAMAWNLGAAGQ
jgi:hypothetical protein